MAGKKHVIILGAGASKGSGYPLANKLRLLMASKSHLQKAITDYEDFHGLRGNPIWREAEACLLHTHKESLELFRNGGFATLDEFCKLAGGRFQTEINGLRRIVRAILGTFNPEEHFERSEYYAFVQALFDEGLVSLRDDLAVLTYNYDPYLEFLLHRALEHRWKVAGGGPQERTDAFNAVTSGFYMPESQQWLSKVPGFCVLKLHGSICFAQEEHFGFQGLFSGGPKIRGEHLFAHEGNKVTPPILFPWEIITATGAIDEAHFPSLGSSTFVENKNLASLFSGIWRRARSEVQAAEKISFVGLSMHPFIREGLSYLLRGKSGQTEIVIANPENSRLSATMRENVRLAGPHSPAGALHEALRSIDSESSYVGKHAQSLGLASGRFTLVDRFDGFIKTEMRATD